MNHVQFERCYIDISPHSCFMYPVCARGKREAIDQSSPFEGPIRFGNGRGEGRGGGGRGGGGRGGGRGGEGEEEGEGEGEGGGEGGGKWSSLIPSPPPQVSLLAV